MTEALLKELSINFISEIKQNLNIQIMAYENVKHPRNWPLTFGKAWLSDRVAALCSKQYTLIILGTFWQRSWKIPNFSACAFRKTSF